MKRSVDYIDSMNTFFSVRHNRNTSWNMLNYHFHQTFEIYYSLSDNIKFFVSDNIYNVNRGDLFVFNQFDLHRSVAPENIEYERYVINFSSDYIQDLSTPSTNLLACFLSREKNFSHCIHLTDIQSERLLYLCKKAEYYCIDNAYGSDVYKRIVLAEILLFVNSLYQTSTIVIPLTNDADFKKIAPVLHYIQQHLGENLCLDRLSREFYLSKSHLSALFKKVTGFTINEYIIHRRIMLAGTLLKKGIPVMVVCETSGFNNLSHFIRTFTGMMHISPKKYANSAENHLMAIYR